MHINSPQILALQADAQLLIAKNANTVDSALGNRGITTNAVAVPETYWCDMNWIGYRARMAIPATGVQQVPLTLSNSAAASNATNFQSGDTALDNIAVTVAHYSRPAFLSRAEQGHALVNEHVTESLKRLAAQDIVATQAALVVSATHGAANVSAAVGSITAANLTTLSADCVSTPKTLLTTAAGLGALDGDLQLGSDGYQYPGIQNIREVRGAIGDAHTIVAGPEAFVFIVEKPEAFNHYPPGELQIKEIVLPTLNIPAWHIVWIDRATRSSWQSIELLFGIAPANVNALSYAATP